MMGIKDEDEDGIHSHMLLGKKREGGLSPILFSLCFLITNKKTFYPTEHRFISKS